MVEGREINNAMEIKKEIKKFYAKLYQSKQGEEEREKDDHWEGKASIREYLEKCDLFKTTENQTKILNDPISQEEIVEAIKKTKSGNTWSRRIYSKVLQSIQRSYHNCISCLME